MSSNATQSHKPWRTITGKKTAGKEGCFSGTAKKRCAKRKPTKPVQRMCMVINARMLLVTTYWCAKSPTSPIWPLGRRMCCESSKRSSSRKGLIMYSMFSIDSKPAPAASAQRNTASGVSARRHQQVQTLVENQKQQVRGTALPWHLSTQVASWSTHQGLVFIRHRIQPALNSSSQSPGVRLHWTICHTWHNAPPLRCGWVMAQPGEMLGQRSLRFRTFKVPATVTPPMPPHQKKSTSRPIATPFGLPIHRYAMAGTRAPVKTVQKTE
mmetsp:Transcript_103778/g.288993  ORF Transcript_103778/g.288993 Transcript_103778/m.288993 type:complete len:268 (-) Transcript_103778:80-883(-)